jgi:hypothetical protein
MTAIPPQISSYLNSGLLSASYATAVRESHKITARADVWYGGHYVQSLPIVSGTIQVDRTAQNCRSGTCTIGDPSFFPTYITSPISPFGTELRIFSGLVYGSGSTEWVPVGVFTIEDVSAEDSTGGLPVIDFFDRSKIIQRAQFFYPHDRSGWDVKYLTTRLINDVCPQAKVIFDPSITYTKNLPGGTIFTEDRWAAVQSCCALLGAEGRFGWDGNFYVLPIPSLLGSVGPDPTNVAAGAPVTASSVFNSSFPAAAAVDGSFSTRWSSIAYVDPQWIYVDLGSPQALAQVVLAWDYKAYASNYLIQISNDLVTWTTIYTNGTGKGGYETINVTGTGRYVRMFGQQRANPSWRGYSLVEFKIYLTGGVPSQPPAVWNFNSGPGGVLVSAKRGVARTGVANFISVTGKSNGLNQTPVGYAWDSDSRSPTFWGLTQNSGELQPSLFGSNVVNLSNDLLTTSAECTSYAASQLGHYLGMARSLDFTAVPNPALDAGDVVTVIYKNGTREFHIMDSFQLPLGLDIMGDTAAPGRSPRRHQVSATGGMKVGPTDAVAKTAKTKAIPATAGNINSGNFVGRTRTLTYQTASGT